jgi:hypothetical protein
MFVHWLKKPLLPGNLVTTGNSHDVAVSPDSVFAQGDDHTHGGVQLATWNIPVGPISDVFHVQIRRSARDAERAW